MGVWRSGEGEKGAFTSTSAPAAFTLTCTASPVSRPFSLCHNSNLSPTTLPLFPYPTHNGVARLEPDDRCRNERERAFTQDSADYWSRSKASLASSDYGLVPLTYGVANSAALSRSSSVQVMLKGHSYSMSTFFARAQSSLTIL